MKRKPPSTKLSLKSFAIAVGSYLGLFVVLSAVFYLLNYLFLL
ncbi:hypothetical protein DealDRAFT_2503 [Dethiobacter alkaliphilus AHT 1]|uniref:Uncharacterized protein n=1 Tax=Dethiobacter alkaliphilus AHT 1 TaxID=555088 RepID=C0GJ44_DETAL|nr:hypothetical protein DealDRAFT_2503 [Dethiobacter alkaliphilus AHT 1]